MKTKNAWLIPGLFFLAAALANLCGKLMGNEMLAAAAKPALLPLIALTTLAAVGNMDSKMTRLLVTAQLLGCTGDILLLFSGFLPFVGGMAAFLAGHICYITLFGGQSWKGFSAKIWIPALLVMAAIVAALITVIGVEGDLLVPMIIYGFTLMMLIFSGLCGGVRFGTAAWWLILCGTVLFTFSDALIAVDTFSESPIGWIPFGIMFTYILAQALLATGSVKLIGGR